MKIIHCADLHLDSTLGSHLPPHIAKERRNELFGTFCRMVEWAKKNKVRAVIIAGDLFDTEKSVRNRTRQEVCQVIKDNPSLSFLYTCGNHDRDESFVGMCTSFSNFYFLQDECICLTNGKEKVYVGGSLNCEFPKNQLNILCLHTDINSETKLMSVSKEVKYLALGHIHKYQTGPLPCGGQWCYPGCLEGRGFDECGPKGFVLLETGENNTITKTFVPFASRTLHKITVNLSGIETFQTILEKLKKAVSGIPSTDMVEAVLTGEINEQSEIDEEGLEQVIGELFYFVRIKNNTTFAIEPERYKNDLSLKGEFVRLVMEMDLSATDKNRIINTGLSYILGRGEKT